MKKVFLFLVFLIICTAGCKMESDRVIDAARTWVTAVAMGNFERFNEIMDFNELHIMDKHKDKTENLGLFYSKLDNESAQLEFKKNLFENLRRTIYKDQGFFNAGEMDIYRTSLDKSNSTVHFRFKKEPSKRTKIELRLKKKFSTKEWMITFIGY